MDIQKRFPANTCKIIKNEKGQEVATFLADSKIDGALYAYLLNQSYGEKGGRTLVDKKNLPSLAEIGRIIGQSRYIKSKGTIEQKPMCRQTVATHLKYLLNHGYLKENEQYYEILNPENCYCSIPLDTLNFLTDTLRLEVIKTYLYLKQRNTQKPGQWFFTQKEICEHLGIDYTTSYKVISNYLTILSLLELIEIQVEYQNQVPYYHLLKVNNTVKKLC